MKREVPLAEPEVLEHLSRRSGVIFEPLGNHVGRSKDDDPLGRWEFENPLYAGGGAGR